MKYDFTTIIDRKGKDAMALDAVGFQKGHVKKPTLPKEGFRMSSKCHSCLYKAGRQDSLP